MDKIVEKETKTKSGRVTKDYKDYPVTMRELLECGVHFGHQTRRWNPRMKKYIYTARNDVHVIDLQQSIELIKSAYDFVKDCVEKKGSILFVGTKKQAQEAVFNEATRCKMPYINQRWLGGTLTNNATISNSIKTLKAFEEEQELGLLDKISKKEASRKQKKLAKLQRYLGGLKTMRYLPKAIFVIDTKKEELAINEARAMGIKIIGLVDTNGDPTHLDFPIPGNDDAIRAIKLICGIIANAVDAGAELSITESDDLNQSDAKDSAE